MARTPQEIFGHHGKALMDGDLDEIMADYGPDSVFPHTGWDGDLIRLQTVRFTLEPVS
jgi:hypothetical protein